MTDTNQSPELIDIQHVTCGLVPLMQTHLEGSDPEVTDLRFKIRQGIETELWNSFGTGGNWILKEIRNELFYDVAVFERAELDELDPLGLLDF